MSGDNIYEVIVIGAGIMGSATAYYLSKEFGKKVLLLEQFDFLHRKGSSHGESRLIRATYAEDHYTILMKDAYKFWEEVEKEYGTVVLTKTGGLDISKPDNPYFQSILASAKKYHLDVELLTREQVTEKFPVMRLTPGLVALYSPDGGLLNATKCVAMYQSLAHKNGCVLKDNSVVKNLVEDLNENLVSVHVSDGHVYRGKKVIVTAGPWSKKLLKETQGLDLPLVTKLSTVSYWKVNDPTAYSWERFPAQLLHEPRGSWSVSSS